MEAEAAEEDVAKRPAEGGQDAALLLGLDDVRVHQVLGVAVVLVVGVRGEQLQVHVLGVAVEELGARLANDLGVGAEAGVADVGLDLALCVLLAWGSHIVLHLSLPPKLHRASAARKAKLTLAVIVSSSRHVPDGDGDNVGGLLLAGNVDNLNDPVLVRGVKVLLQQRLDLLDVGGILAALGGDKVGPEALLVDGRKDDLDDRGQVLWFGGTGLHVCGESGSGRGFVGKVGDIVEGAVFTWKT